MKRLHGLGNDGMSKETGLRHRGGNPCLRLGYTAVILAVCLAMTRPAAAQVVPSANGGNLTLAAGATGSGFYLQYGERKMLGLSGFVDLDTSRRIGIEAEGRWLEFHKTADVHAETYSIGPRYHMDFGRFQPYAKGMIGFGKFNFPYNYAHGSYLVVTGGVGTDYILSRRIHIRVADLEYQSWPQFAFGAMTSLGVSTGIRVRIF
jgi:hypothetical protein